jgi:hypothetical protein
MGSALPSLGLPSKADIYAAALEGLVQVNGIVLAKENIPPMYQSGARWKNIPHHNWRRADQITGEGWGDCEGLSSWRTAELRVTGEDENARVGVYHTGPRTYHAVVIRGDDNIEDPSVLLGMKPRRNMPLTRGQMNYINGMWPKDVRRGGAPLHSIVIGDLDDGDDSGGGPDDSIPTTQFIDHPDGGTAAQVTMPLGDGTGIIATTSPSDNTAVAAAKAANMIADISHAVAKNPSVLKNLAYVNPYTAAAMALYSQPDVNRALKRAGSALSSLRRIF